MNWTEEGTTFGNGIGASTLPGNVKAALHDGLVSAAPEIASDLDVALAHTSYAVGQNLGTGLATGLAPTVAAFRQEMATTRKVVAVVGGGLIAVSAAKLLYKVFFSKKRR